MAKGNHVLRAFFAGQRRTQGVARLVSSRHFVHPFSTSATAPQPPPPPATVSTNASNIMADEAQLGRHFYLNKVLDHWASRESTKMTLRQLLFFGRSLGRDPDKILKSANYVREELSIRIAQRIRDMQDLPFVVMTNEHLEKVYQMYWKAFDRFRRWPVIVNHDDNEKFVALLKELLHEHETVIPSLALGIVEVSEHIPPAQLEIFMQKMLKSRISRRVLAEQHIALSEALDDPFAFFSIEPANSQPEHIGIIHTHVSVRSIIQESISLLTQIFAQAAGVSVEEAQKTQIVPEVVVDGDLNAHISYIPEHLSFIVFELIKDAIRAVMRFKPEERDTVSIRATIVEGPPEDDLIIRISDCGGGVSDLLTRLASMPKDYNINAGNPTAYASPPFAGIGDVSSPTTMPATFITGQGAVATSSSTASPLSSNSPPTSADAGSFADRTRSPMYPIGLLSPATNLTDVLCSFSNVRRRLELEDEVMQEEARVGELPKEQQQDTRGQDRQASSATISPLLGASAQAGLGSRSKLEQLRRTSRFKGTVGEQIPQRSPSNHVPSATGGSGHPEDLNSSIATTSLGLADTGLGMALARVYAEFFGGSLSFRSLDGHGQDVYLKVPKLGVIKEGGEELGL